MMSTIGMFQGAEKVQKRTNFRFWVWSFRVVPGSTYFFVGNLVPQRFWEREPTVVCNGSLSIRPSSSSLPFSLPSFPFSPETPDTQASAMEAMIIENEEKMVKFVGKTSCKWTILLLISVEILRSSFCGICCQINSPV